MNPSQSNVIYQAEDQFGSIEVIENNNHRTLHFGTPDIQSDINLNSPHHLSLGYMQAMLNTLLLCNNPRRILMVGLGGGSMVHFLLHHFPKCHIDAIECRQAVADIAQQFFMLSDHPNLNIIVDDAGHFCFCADKEKFNNYDLIFIDAFIGNSIAREVCGQGFSDTCYQRLTNNGLFSMNLWSGSFISSKELLEGVNNTFDGQVIRLPVKNKSNIIAIAYKGVIKEVATATLQQNAEYLTKQLKLDISPLLTQLTT